MSASFLAAGPRIRPHTTLEQVRNVDVAPTILHILGANPLGMDGRVLFKILR
jgi:hypothetical protein